MNIITLTLNPAIDTHVRCSELRQNADNLYTLEGRDSGGKGVNVSRALKVFGTDSICCVFVGRDNAESYLAPLERMRMNLRVKIIGGAVRENINVHTDKGDTVLAGEGACVDISALAEMKNELLPLIDSETYFCFCGRIPPSADKSQVIEMLKEFKSRGARLILDSSSLCYGEVAELHPYLIKPNYDELCRLIGVSELCYEDIVRSAVSLAGNIADNVFITLGADGAVYASVGLVRTVKTPPIEALSTTGAGDSLIAGFLAAVSRGLSEEEKISEAAAFGTAACLTRGTEPPVPSDVERLRGRIVLKTVK